MHNFLKWLDKTFEKYNILATVILQVNQSSFISFVIAKWELDWLAKI